MFPSFLELLKASLGHKNVNFNYFLIIHGKKNISCSGATSTVHCFSKTANSNRFKGIQVNSTKYELGCIVVRYDHASLDEGLTVRPWLSHRGKNQWDCQDFDP